MNAFLWTIVGLGFILVLVAGCAIAYLAGRVRGFNDCWNQYCKDYWDRKEQTIN